MKLADISPARITNQIVDLKINFRNDILCILKSIRPEKSALRINGAFSNTNIKYLLTEKLHYSSSY